MKARVQKLMALLLALAMSASLVSTTAWAEPTEDEAEVDVAQTQNAEEFEAEDSLDLQSNEIEWVEVSNYSQLKEQLEAEGTAYIRFKNDIDEEIYYSSSFVTLISVSGNKVLDLNGKSVEFQCEGSKEASVGSTQGMVPYSKYDLVAVRGVTVESYSDHGITLAAVNEGAKLVMVDSSNNQSGKLQFGAKGVENTDDVGKLRNLFEVNGTLVVEGGSYRAGSEKSVWHTATCELGEGYRTILGMYTGYIQEVVNGTVFTVNSGGNLIVNGGNFIARGYKRIKEPGYGHRGDFIGYRAAVLELRVGSKTVINDGKFQGRSNANVVNMESISLPWDPKPELLVRSGKFITSQATRYRGWDAEYETLLTDNNVTTYVTNSNSDGGHGRIGIPTECFAAGAQVSQNNRSEYESYYHGDTTVMPPVIQIVKLDAENTYHVGSDEAIRMENQSYYSNDDLQLPDITENGPHQYNRIYWYVDKKGGTTDIQKDIIMKWADMDPVERWTEAAHIYTYSKLNNPDISLTIQALLEGDIKAHPEHGGDYYQVGDTLYITCMVEHVWSAAHEGSFVQRTIYDYSGLYTMEIVNPAVPGNVSTTGYYCGNETKLFFDEELDAVPNKQVQWLIRETETGQAYEIPGATGLTYTPTAEDVGKYIAVRVMAPGYDGWLLSTYTQVRKLGVSRWPDRLDISATTNSITINNYNPDQEYIYSFNQDGPDWDNDPYFDGDTVTGLTGNRTYYVYTRFKETATRDAGFRVRYNSVVTGDEVYLLKLNLLDGNVVDDAHSYADTILIPKGSKVTFTMGDNMTASPGNFNKHADIVWAFSEWDIGATTNSYLSLTASTQTTDLENYTITITGKEVTPNPQTVAALYRQGYGSPNMYGKWNVVVYDPNDLRASTVVVSNYTRPFEEEVVVHEGETIRYEPAGYTLLPDTAIDRFTQEVWSVPNGYDQFGVAQGYSTTGNDYVSFEQGSSRTLFITGEKVPENGRYQELFLERVWPEGPANDNTIRVGFIHVTVLPKSDNPITELTLPDSMSLNVGQVTTLPLEIGPINHTEDAGNIVTTSNNPSVVSVGENRVITANAPGTATIVCQFGSLRTECVVTVNEEPVIEPGKTTESAFTDVNSGDWFFNAVNWAVENGVTAGMGDGTFGSNNVCTRAQIVTFMWNNAGKPETGIPESPFTDVKEGDWYYNAVLWAYENGITAGMGDGTFGVNLPCTRAQAVTFMWNADGKPEPTSTENPFTDVKEGDWFYQSVLWAVEHNITAGMGNGTFGSTSQCTRAHIVTFLWNAAGKPT